MRKTLIAALLLTLASPALAEPEPEPLWKKVGVWQVHVDRTIGRKCFVVTTNPSWRTALRIGFDGRTSDGHMLLANEAWRSLDTGQKRAITIRIDSEAGWEVEASGVLWDKMPVLSFLVPAELIAEVMYGQTMVVRHEGRIILNTKLNGSHAAITEMMDCQKAMNKRDLQKASDDPFEDRTRAAHDPFAR